MNKTNNKPVLLAHRGTSTMAPENTAPAFDFALYHGADVLEIDVRLSRDGEVVVIHDETLERTTNGTGKVRDFALSALKRLDAGDKFDAALAPAAAKISTDSEQSEVQTFARQGVQLLTLGELYSMYPKMRVNIDIKDNSDTAVNAVARVISKHDAASRSVVASFHDEVLEHCRLSHPWLVTSAGMNDVKRFYWWYLQGQRGASPELPGLFQLPTHYYCIPLATRHFISAVHNSGAEINYWTINQPSKMIRLIEKGADGLVTDRMDLVRDLLERGALGA